MWRRFEAQPRRRGYWAELYRWEITYIRKDDPDKVKRTEEIGAMNAVACGVYFKSAVGQDLSKLKIVEVRAIGTHPPKSDRFNVFPGVSVGK